MRNPLLSVPVAALLLLGSVMIFTNAGCASSPPRPARTEARAVASADGDGFSSIVSRGWVDVRVAIGDAESVQVKCTEDLLPKIHTRVRVEDKALVVETDDNTWGVFRWGTSSYRDEAMCVVDVQVRKLTTVAASGSGDVRVTGNADGLTRISTSGSGNIRVASLKTPATLSLTSAGSGTLAIDALHAGDVQAEIAGSGDVRASGSARSVHAHLVGSGELDARALRTEDGHVRSSGSGECRLFASRRVDIESNGSGDIVVMGHPSEKTSKVHGSASVRWE